MTLASVEVSNVGTWFHHQVIERVRLHSLTFVRDGLVIALAYCMAEAVRFTGWPQWADLQWFFAGLPIVVVIHLTMNYRFGIHRRIWQYVGVRDLRALAQATILSGMTILLVDFPINPRPLPVSVVPTGGGLALLGLVGIRFWREIIGTRLQGRADRERLIIVGAGQAGRLVVADLLGNPRSAQKLIGFLDDDPRKQSMRIHGLPVLGGVDSLPEIVTKHRIDLIGLAITRASAVEIDRIVALAQETTARILILPSPAEAMATKTPLRLRDIDLDDLLDRDPESVLDDPQVRSCIRGRTVLVTGARGSIGFELCRQALRLNPAKVLAVDNNETGLFYLLRELAGEPNARLIVPVLADVTNMDRLEKVFAQHKPEVIFHAAAYKHVPLLETFPEAAVSVNVVGTLNLCRLATQFGTERFVFVSTDKAVKPANILGYSKRVGELIVRAHAGKDTIFCSVRFGNVIGSRGSALPEFVRQIDEGGPVLITHPDVERYFMTIAEATGLVILAGAMASDRELYMLDMGKPIKIADLVHRMIRLRGLRADKDIAIVFTGLRPGEKMSEDLVFADESSVPTDSPSVFRVEDQVEVDLAELMRQVDELRESAENGRGHLPEQLESVARGQRPGRRLTLATRR